jgi:hypothetical protein
VCPVRCVSRLPRWARAPCPLRALAGVIRRTPPPVPWTQVFTDEGVASKDYIFERGCLNGTTLHVRSAPSPGCTASLAIAEHVVTIADEDFKLGAIKA